MSWLNILGKQTPAILKRIINIRDNHNLLVVFSLMGRIDEHLLQTCGMADAYQVEKDEQILDKTFCDHGCKP